VKSGTQKERRLAQTSVRAFYEEEYVPFATENGLTIRVQQTVVNWLHDAGIRPCVFDRYRCQTCFLGRQVEARVRNGTSKAGDRDTYEDYKKHLRIIENQREKVKEDKALKDRQILTAVFDYSTFHDLTSEKVCVSLIESLHQSVTLPLI